VKRRLLLLADALLLVVAAFLGVRLYEAWTARAPAPPAEPSSSASAEVAAPPAAVAPGPPLTAFNVVAERNLFSPTRSETAPEPPRSAGLTPAAPPAPKPRLYGVVILAEGRGRAYLEDVQRRKVFSYSVGDLVGDARLEQIKADRVVLRRGGETFEVLLNDPAKPRQPTPPSGVQSGVQSSEAGGVVRPTPTRPPGPAPPIGGIRSPGRPRVPTPVPAPPPSSEGQESPPEEE
jgi:Type II secretion system protein C